MTVKISLSQAFERTHKALNILESAVATRLESQAHVNQIEKEVQRMNADRSRLAQELDKSKAHVEKMSLVNQEVARRLITAMETIRTVIER